MRTQGAFGGPVVRRLLALFSRPPTRSGEAGDERSTSRAASKKRIGKRCTSSTAEGWRAGFVMQRVPHNKESLKCKQGQPCKLIFTLGTEFT